MSLESLTKDLTDRRVLGRIPARGDIYRLTSWHLDDPTTVVVMLLEYRVRPHAPMTSGWYCVVVGGDSKTYTKGGSDIYVFAHELRERAIERHDFGANQTVVRR